MELSHIKTNINLTIIFLSSKTFTFFFVFVQLFVMYKRKQTQRHELQIKMKTVVVSNWTLEGFFKYLFPTFFCSQFSVLSENVFPVHQSACVCVWYNLTVRIQAPHQKSACGKQRVRGRERENVCRRSKISERDGVRGAACGTRRTKARTEGTAGKVYRSSCSLSYIVLPLSKKFHLLNIHFINDYFVELKLRLHVRLINLWYLYAARSRLGRTF